MIYSETTATNMNWKNEVMRQVNCLTFLLCWPTSIALLENTVMEVREKLVHNPLLPDYAASVQVSDMSTLCSVKYSH